MAEIAAEFLPPGVFNVVSGDRDTGRALVEHPTPGAWSPSPARCAPACRSPRAPRRDVKRVHLELGGKAPVIVFDDADIEAAAEGIAVAGYFNAGQDCTAATRVLAAPAHPRRLRRGAGRVRQERGQGRPARRRGRAARPGQQRATSSSACQGFLDRLPDHASVAAGGHRLDGLGDGFFLEPTVVSGLQQDDEAIQDEIFGPVITVQRFTDEAEALALGQRRRLRPGLQRLDQGLRPGDADVQGARLRLRLDQHPHPARRRDAARRLQAQSGYGKDLSMYGFEDYTRIKHVMANIDS